MDDKAKKELTALYHELKGGELEFNPTHDYELLKKHRREQFDKQKIGDNLVKESYLQWLKAELKIIDKWKEGREPEDIQDILEYEIFVKSELKRPKIKPKSGNTFSQKQIAIAYRLMGKVITKDNYKDILEKYSNTTSNRILSKHYEPSDLSRATENKSADTKHLNDLKECERLLISLNNQKGIKAIKPIITAFSITYKNLYHS